MEVRVRENSGVCVVGLAGELTFGGGDVIFREVVAELLRSKRGPLILDLERVVDVDSAGIGELVACAKRARSAGADVKLLNPSDKIRKVLEITRFSELFETYSDEQTAVQSF